MANKKDIFKRSLSKRLRFAFSDRNPLTMTLLSGILY